MRSNKDSSASALRIALFAFVVLGLADGVIGPVWPDLRDSFSRTNASFGLIFAFWSGGYLAASAASGHVSDRTSIGTTLTRGTSVAVVGMSIVAISPSWWLVLTGFALLGIGNGLTDATANAWVALTAGPREMGALHTAYGVGATSGPLLATAFVATHDLWRGPFFVLIFFQIAAAVAIVRRRHAFMTPPASSDADSDASSSVRHPATTATALLIWFGLYVGVEVSIGQWSYTLLTEGRGVEEVLAGGLTASFWIGLTIGRLALAVFGNRLDPARALGQALAGALLAVAVFWLDPGGFGGLALPALGMCFSIMFPLAVTLTPSLLGSERAGRQVGYQLATSSLGAVVVPALIGLLAEDHGVEVTGPVSAAVVVAMVGSWAVVRREMELSSSVS